MSNFQIFCICERIVKTILIDEAPVLDRYLKDLLSTITQNSDTKRVVGLDIKKTFFKAFSSDYLLGHKVSERVALLILYHGTTCLIIQLHLMISAPCSLSAFLQLPELSFVGVGIGHSLQALERDYGINSRNAVDLGELAAVVMADERFRSYGLFDLVEKVCPLLDVQGIMRSLSDAALSNWATVKLSYPQFGEATWSTFLTFSIGNHLFGG